MKFIVLIAVLMFVGVVHAHNTEDLTEAQLEVQMMQEDLSKGFERAALLQNTILSASVDQAKKCEYTQELARLTVELGYLVSQYGNAGGQSDAGMFYDESQSLRQMHAEQLKSHLITIQSIIPTFQANNHCE